MSVDDRSPYRGGNARLLAQGVEPSCIACIFFIMTASGRAQLFDGAEPQDLGAGLVLHRDVAGRRMIVAMASLKAHEGADGT
ncbi:MAG TPA: hypothetical protein VNA32_05970 [Actinomycetota bacterium]|nr:hypothetical protein [Actinomycetota bacterium]